MVLFEKYMNKFCMEKDKTRSTINITLFQKRLCTLHTLFNKSTLACSSVFSSRSRAFLVPQLGISKKLNVWTVTHLHSSEKVISDMRWTKYTRNRAAKSLFSWTQQESCLPGTETILKFWIFWSIFLILMVMKAQQCFCTFLFEKHALCKEIKCWIHINFVSVSLMKGWDGLLGLTNAWSSLNNVIRLV